MSVSCLHQFLAEFRLKQFGFRGIVYDRIFFSQWRIPPLAFIIFKLVLTVYVDFWLIYTADRYEDMEIDLPWAAFLTNWTYTLLALYLTMSTTAVVIYHVVRSLHNRRRGQSWLCSTPGEAHGTLMHEDLHLRPKREATVEEDSASEQVAIIRRDSPTWYVVFIWILFNMTAVAVPMVTLMFFAFLFPSFSGGIDNDNLQLHGLNTVCMLVDFMLSPFPVRVYHVIYPLIYGVVYILFTVIYWAGDHNRVVYPGVLDWNEPGKTVGIMFLVIAIMVIFQFLLYGLHRLKVMIYHKMFHYEPIE